MRHIEVIRKIREKHRIEKINIIKKRYRIKKYENYINILNRLNPTNKNYIHKERIRRERMRKERKVQKNIKKELSNMGKQLFNKYIEDDYYNGMLKIAIRNAYKR